jgi:hypothetical protein
MEHITCKWIRQNKFESEKKEEKKQTYVIMWDTLMLNGFIDI